MAFTRPPTRDADLEASSSGGEEEDREQAGAGPPDASDLDREWAARRARFWNVSRCVCTAGVPVEGLVAVATREGWAGAWRAGGRQKRLAFFLSRSLINPPTLSLFQAGFREGRDAGHEADLQPGFDAGFAQGAAAGLRRKAAAAAARRAVDVRTLVLGEEHAGTKASAALLARLSK